MASTEPATGKRKPKKSHLLRNVLIVLFAVLFSAGAVVSSPPILFFNVTVSGTVHVTRVGAVPANVTFVDENLIPYVAAVGAGGNYSITLMNGHTFSVYVGYTLEGKTTGGNCSASSLDLNTLGYSTIYDASC